MAIILVAEDEPDIRELISFTLKYNGYEVLLAKNGEQALEILRDTLPDLILLDVRMPRVSGYEVCQAIRQDERTRDIPVAFLSAKGQESEITMGMRAGADAYILKPFSPDDLLHEIHKLIE